MALHSITLLQQCLIQCSTLAQDLGAECVRASYAQTDIVASSLLNPHYPQIKTV